MISAGIAESDTDEGSGGIRPAIKGVKSNKSFEQTPKIRLWFALRSSQWFNGFESAAQLNSMLGCLNFITAG